MMTYMFLWNSNCTENSIVKVFSMKAILRRKTTNFPNPEKAYHYYIYSFNCCLKWIHLMPPKIKKTKTKTKPWGRNTVLSHKDILILLIFDLFWVLQCWLELKISKTGKLHDDKTRLLKVPFKPWSLMKKKIRLPSLQMHLFHRLDGYTNVSCLWLFYVYQTGFLSS